VFKCLSHYYVVVVVVDVVVVVPRVRVHNNIRYIIRWRFYSNCHARYCPGTFVLELENIIWPSGPSFFYPHVNQCQCWLQGVKVTIVRLQSPCCLRWFWWCTGVWFLLTRINSTESAVFREKKKKTCLPHASCIHRLGIRHTHYEWGPKNFVFDENGRNDEISRFWRKNEIHHFLTKNRQNVWK